MLVKRNQRGAVLVFSLFLLMIIFAIGALIIDLLRVERAARTLQRASDAVALAGASQFRRTLSNTDGLVADWTLSKRAMFAALRANPVFGDFGEVLNPDQFGVKGGSPERGERDTNYESPDSDYAFTVYDFPNLSVQLERIYYYRSTDTVSIGEVSLEGRSMCGPTAPVAQVPPSCCRSDVAVFQVANAIRATLTLKRLPFFFGQFVGLQGLSSLTRTALGTADILPPGNIENCP